MKIERIECLQPKIFLRTKAKDFASYHDQINFEETISQKKLNFIKQIQFEKSQKANA